MVDLDALARRLQARPPSPAWRWLSARRAAVAVILDDDRRVLLMDRAERRGDRWSGHVSLPGGMASAADGGLRETAARETREEVGVDVGTMEMLGALDEIRAIDHAGRRPMTIAPFVFRTRDPLDPKPGPEVAGVFWLPLDLAAGGTLDDRLRYPILGIPFRFPCWRYEGHAVWGLTFGLLRTLLRLARP